MSNKRSPSTLPTPLAIQQEPTPAATNAGLITGSAFPALMVLQSYAGTATEPRAVLAELNEKAEAIQHGDLSQIESMLFHQAVALQTMFMDMAARARKQETQSGMQCLTQLALRAQSSSRATLQALAEMKNPRQVAFVQQQNVAHNQQVNNVAALPPHAEKPTPAPNKLLVEEPYGRQELDTRATSTAGRNDRALETVDALDRPRIRRRKEQSLS